MKRLLLSILLLGLGSTLATFVSRASPASSPVWWMGPEDERVEKIAFYSKRSGNCQIYLMNTDGSGLQRLTNNSAKDMSPAISPDGAKIAFASNRDGESRIHLMNIDGSDQRRLTNTTNVEILPSWSPDGTKIYFQIEVKGGNSILCVCSSDGKEFRKLTDGSVGYIYPMPSPSGREILCNDNGFRVYGLDADGRNPRRIGDTTTMRLRPTWSPDGRRIAYGLLHGMPPNHTTEVGVMDSDGGHDAAVTRNASVNEFPCWSPDGRHIAFQSARDGNFEIYVINADGSEPRRLTNDPGFDGAPSWGLVKMPSGKCP